MASLIWVSNTARAGGFQLPGGSLALETCTGMAEALELLAGGDAAVLLAELPLEGWSAEDVLEAARQAQPAVPVILADPSLTMRDAVQLAHLGAFQCLDHAPDLEELNSLARRAAQSASSEDQDTPQEAPWQQMLIGQSRPMRQIAHVIGLVAQRRCTVLITGETGTGKEMVARALHMASDRARMPLVAVNCSAIPDTLLEAELFGHVKGAFTGALMARVGRFEQAHRGTLFLDEIGDMPMELQAKLLRVLQEREFQRLGSSDTVRVDVRVVAATNGNLPELVRRGQFREDLYYRLNVVPVQVPALRQRRDDIPLLVRHFIEKHCRAEGIPVKHASPDLIARLAAYSWPGNVRELENAVEMAVALSGDRRALFPRDFPLSVSASPAPAPPVRTAEPEESGGEPVDFCAAVSRFEQEMLRGALEKAHGNKTLAAGMLGLKRTTFLTKLRAFSAELA